MSIGVSPQLGFRGLYRPGLIEALRAGVPGRLADQVSGGFTAPASLKQGRIRLGVSPVCVSGGFTAPASLKLPRRKRAWGGRPRFRGLYRPGLIEAGGVNSHGDSVSKVSGGFTAPASLKRCPPRPRRGRPRRFRGLYRPGLIEAHGTLLSAPATCRGFRGLYRPGLIEACRRAGG